MAGAWTESAIDSMTMSAAIPSKSVVRKPTNSLGERSRTMIIIGVDFHPELQQTASVDTDTVELQEKRCA